MRDKYNEIIKEYSIDNRVKDKILEKVVNKHRDFRLAYITSFMVLAFSVISVSGYEIIKKWGGIERSTENGVTIVEAERDFVKTNVDDMIIDDGVYSDFMKLTEIEKFLGIDILSLDDSYKDSLDNSEYVLSKYSNDNDKVQTISIRELGKMKDENSISLNAYVITKNFPKDKIEFYNFDTGYDYKDLIFVDKVLLNKLNTEAIVYTQTYMKNDTSYEAYHIEFSHNNIKYILSTTEETKLSNVLEVLNSLK